MRHYILETVQACDADGWWRAASAAWASTHTSEAEARAAYAAAVAEPTTLAAVLIVWDGEGSLGRHESGARHCRAGARETVLAHGDRPWSVVYRPAGGGSDLFVGRWEEHAPPAETAESGGGSPWRLSARPQSDPLSPVEHLPEYPWSRTRDGWSAVA